MRVTFTTDAYADIFMFGDVALAMLKMMGHSTAVPGAILAADMPAALIRLKAAIEAEQSPSPVEDKDADEPVGGWFAARPPGTEDIYKRYAESFRGADHLCRIQERPRPSSVLRWPRPRNSPQWHRAPLGKMKP